jgi:HK97 gp10 family phage protein
MAGKVTIRVDGLKELDKALGELTKATARNTLTRVLKMAGEPIRAAAQAGAPVDTGALRESIIVSTKKPVGHSAKDRAFYNAMKSGATRKQAGMAARTAQKGADEAFAEAFVGPVRQRTKQAAIKTLVQEFGSETQPGTPYMRPAWDTQKMTALEIIKSELGKEIDKAVSRARARAMKKAAKG